MKPAPSRIRHARIIELVAAAAAGGLLSAGGYALAASGGSTIRACADGRTGTLHLEKRCHRGQRRITWNLRGPQGPQGAQGATGPAGQSPVTAWTLVGDSGTTFGGHGISVQHVSAGTYQLTATPAQCVQGFNAPVVTVSDSYPPSGTGSATAFPVAWVGATATNKFTVYTGVVGGGGFTPTDRPFDVQDPCS